MAQKRYSGSKRELDPPAPYSLVAIEQGATIRRYARRTHVSYVPSRVESSTGMVNE
jgi:hypothetical protein